MNDYMSETSKRKEKASVLKRLKKKGKKKLKEERKSPVPGGFDEDEKDFEQGQAPIPISGIN